MANANLTQAKKAKKDEFYTQLADIERELSHYKEHFRGKTVLCNCDDPRISNFFRYFAYNFEHLGLKRLITTCYKSQDMDLFSMNTNEQAIWLEYLGDDGAGYVVESAASLLELGNSLYEVCCRYHTAPHNGAFDIEDAIEILLGERCYVRL